jgi:hypothetical protein
MELLAIVKRLWLRIFDRVYRPFGFAGLQLFLNYFRKVAAKISPAVNRQAVKQVIRLGKEIILNSARLPSFSLGDFPYCTVRLTRPELVT